MRTLENIIRNRPLWCIEQDREVLQAVTLMNEKHIGALPVLDETNRLVGIFTERDLLTRVVATRKDPAKTKISDVMTKDLVVAEPSESYAAAINRMKKHGCRHLPIISWGKLVGIVSLTDLVETDLSEKEDEIKMLKSYIYYVPPT